MSTLRTRAPRSRRRREQQAHRATVVALVLALIALPSAGSAQGLAIPLIHQRATLWCWAASAEMVLDFFAASPLQQESLGQCSLVKNVPEGKACGCNTPNGYDATGGCDFGSPFDAKTDYIPGLLKGAVRTTQAEGGPAIHRELLDCEIHTRKRPVLTWWRNKAYRCERAGHMVVVSDFVERGPGKDLVLIRDPWPVDHGNVYWLTWLGYTCGYKLGGHCVDYYNVAGPPEVPPSCRPETPELDPDDCDEYKAKFDPIPLDDVKGVVSDLLGGDLGPRLRAGLGLPASVTKASCDEAFLVHSARIHFVAGAPVLSRLGSSRLVCSAQGETWRSPFSILLIGDKQAGWRLAGFGAEQTSRLMQQGADPLASALLKATPGAARPLELYEVEIPGTGDLLLIDPSSPLSQSIHLQEPELGVRPLNEVLTDPLAGLGSLGGWLRSLPPAN